MGVILTVVLVDLAEMKLSNTENDILTVSHGQRPVQILNLLDQGHISDSMCLFC